MTVANLITRPIVGAMAESQAGQRVTLSRKAMSVKRWSSL
jgi:hypothetical protein